MGPTVADVIETIDSGAPWARRAVAGVYASTPPTPAPTSVCPISLAAGHEGCSSSSVPVTPRAASTSASGRTGSRQVPREAGRHGRREAGDLLFAVVAREPQVERREAPAGDVVELPENDPRERRDAPKMAMYRRRHPG